MGAEFKLIRVIGQGNLDGLAIVISWRHILIMKSPVGGEMFPNILKIINYLFPMPMLKTIAKQLSRV